MRVDTGENRPQTRMEAGTEIMARLPEQFLKLIRVFIEACKILIFFSSTRHPKNFKPAAPFKKNIDLVSGDPVPLKSLTNKEHWR